MAMFEGGASTQAMVACLRIVSRANATSASCLTVGLSFMPRAETTFKIVSKLRPVSLVKALKSLSLESPAFLATWIIHPNKFCSQQDILITSLLIACAYSND